jgi:hypothetical protein
MTQFRPIQIPSDDSAESVPAPKTPLANALPGETQLTHLLHFEPLSAQSAGLDIPCDPQGRVGLDALGDKLRNDYFFARALIGRLFARPTVRQALPMLHA